MMMSYFANYLPQIMAAAYGGQSYGNSDYSADGTPTPVATATVAPAATGASATATATPTSTPTVTYTATATPSPEAMAPTVGNNYMPYFLIGTILCFLIFLIILVRVLRRKKHATS